MGAQKVETIMEPLGVKKLGVMRYKGLQPPTLVRGVQSLSA